MAELLKVPGTARSEKALRSAGEVQGPSMGASGTHGYGHGPGSPRRPSENSDFRMEIRGSNLDRL